MLTSSSDLLHMENLRFLPFIATTLNWDRQSSTQAASSGRSLKAL